MRPLRIAIAIVSIFLSFNALPVRAAPTRKAPDPVDRVDPFIGTDAHGHVFPGATVPFGMVQLSPDTRTDTWDGASGYHYSDTSIIGFSHNHLSGTGVGDLGNIMLLPLIGEVKPAKFSHADEVARPGYYRVRLPENGINVELTATTHAGFHRYTFPAGRSASVLIDLGHGIANEPVDGLLTIGKGYRAISGYRRSKGWGGEKVFYYAIEFSRPFDARPGVKEKRAVARFEFVPDPNPLLVKVGLSTVSEAAARANLLAEIPAWDFDATVAAARQQWADALNRITIDADGKTSRTFYTALYHSLLAPTVLSDIDGQYRGADGKVHTARGGTYYTTLSLWDTYRAEHPLLTLIAPQRVLPIVQSMLDHARDFDQHRLPIWTNAGRETWCMIGNHAIPVIVDAYLKGFRDFDADEALEAMIRSVEAKHFHQDEYRNVGFVPSTSEDHQSVSRTLEFAYDDACIARFAKALGRGDVAARYAKRAENWRHVFDAESKFMRGKRADGSWVTPFDPLDIQSRDYTEANAWQYTFGVQHDVAGLIDAMGGDKAFVAQLDAMFDTTQASPASHQDVTGLIGQYAHGNEPCHHVAYLYNFAGRADQTQRRVRQIAELYTDQPDGLCGNDDCGQMSAWFVFSAMGFYPVDPAGGVYVIGSPLVNRATIEVGNGKSFTMIAEHNSPKNIYIQSATLNGQPLTRSWISHSEITGGGELRFVMGDRPNATWGSAANDRPPQTIEK